MNMKKPEMKIMRFVNEDVIATSGATPAAFELKGFFDGKSNNLETFVDGIKYNGGDALKAALNNKYGGNYDNLVLTFLDYGESNSIGFGIQSFNQSSNSYSYDAGSSPFLVNANGKYTYSRSDNENYIIWFTQMTN